MDVQQDWRKLTPMYASHLSGNQLLAQGEVFSIGDSFCVAHRLEAPHWHESYELGFVLKGTGLIVLGQREYRYNPGQVYVINDFDPHMGYSDDESQLFVVHFHPKLLESGWIGQMRHEICLPFLPQFGQYGPLLPLDDPLTASLRTLLQAMREEAHVRRPLWDVIACGLLLQAIGLLARQALATKQHTEEDLKRRRALRRLQPVLEFLHHHFREPLSLHEIADTGHMSEAHCCELFQLALGTAPIRYRNSLRLAEARRLLQWSDISIREITDQIGFQSVQEFNRLFRRENGCTPSQLRKQLQK